MEKRSRDNVFLSKIQGIFTVKNTIINHWLSMISNMNKMLAEVTAAAGGFGDIFRAWTPEIRPHQPAFNGFI
ncbi:MAG: hypothetical protein EXS42_03180 [Lacunisphaera sp.]|nr:hypothetical protein [Lacunisphaera sp.]